MKFQPILRETIWGGHKLEPLLSGGAASSRQIGEAWIAWDGLTVANGPCQGRTLAETVEEDPVALLGERLSERYAGRFPLLVKLIDAHDSLSVQVHPDDSYAQEREGQPFGKSEVWLVLDAAPDATIIHGMKRPVSADTIAAAVQAEELGPLMETVPVAPGDVVYNSAGTVHALGKGIFIYELQQSSDLTYRLYDWGRRQADGTSRELHVDKSIDVMIRDPFARHKIRPVDLPGDGFQSRLLCACNHFAAEWLRVKSPVGLSTEYRRFDVLTVLNGSVEVLSGSNDPVGVSTGESVLIPSGLGSYGVRPSEGESVLVKAYVPDLLRDVVLPLREHGVSDTDILQLGGDTAGNDVAKVLSPES